MKILYAIQATGNGHISRAIELLPYLQWYGQVDVVLSGSNAHLDFPLPVKYRSKGLSLFYGNKGGLDYWKMMRDCSLVRLCKEARTLPVEQYDVVLNDFDSLTALACALKGVPSLGFGHQASFQSPLTPRPAKKDFAGEWVLQHFGRATAYLGLHFAPYDQNIVSPILKQSIVQASPSNEGHITVYLSHYSDKVIRAALQAFPDQKFQVFSKSVQAPIQAGNIQFLPISHQGFADSMVRSAGIITGAGFETPAEALYLGKKLLCLPIRGQYEQWCNAEALKAFGVPIVRHMDASFTTAVRAWLEGPAPQPLQLKESTSQIVKMAVDKAMALHKSPGALAGEISQEDVLACL